MVRSLKAVRVTLNACVGGGHHQSDAGRPHRHDPVHVLFPVQKAV